LPGSPAEAKICSPRALDAPALKCLGAKTASGKDLMRRSVAVAALLAVTAWGSACKAGQDAKPAAELKTEDDKTLYAIGLMIGRQVGPLNLTPAELEIVKSGISDQATGKKPQVELETYGPKVQQFAQTRAKAASQVEKTKSQTFADDAAKEAGAVKTSSGLVFKTLTPGNGASPAATDTVKVHYKGTLTNGTEFDSSIKRGQPVEFALNQVIPCWTEGVQKMKVGETAKLVCPSEIAYGDQGRPPTIPGGATLVFEVQLIDIVKR
jgi:FKBP-type peptidyl-prolyl cis-trans isomerase FkpA